MQKTFLSSSYISALCAELGMAIKSGIPANEGIYMIMQDETDNKKRELLKALYNGTSDGKRLTDAIKSVGAFPDYMISMLEIGEKTGRLDNVLTALSEYYNRQEKISTSIRSAVMFPSILLFILLMVVVVIITQVLPVFNDVFEQLGAQMSDLAYGIMEVGIFISNNSIWLISILIVIFLGGAVIFNVQKVRYKTGNFFFKAFRKTRIAERISAARFAASLSMTLSSGLDFNESLDMVEQLGLSTGMSEKIETCRSLINSGNSFGIAVTKSGIFPPIYGRMLTIGIKIGTTDQVMSEIASRSEETVKNEIERVIGKIEPTIVVIMSLLVGVILLSVMLPLLSIMTSL